MPIDLSVSVSTAFHPTAHQHLPKPDTIMLSSDAVLFFVHSTTILIACDSAFQSFLGSPLDDPIWRNTLITLDAPSAELNVLLHMLYGKSCAVHSPPFGTLSNAIDRMLAYSIPPATHILPSTSLYNVLLSYAPLHPLDLYALAAHHNLHSLAVSTSSHLLSYSLPTITDDQAERMGSVYLRKLVLLQLDRFLAMKNILLKLPHPHAPTKLCGFTEQKRLSRVWALASASWVWDAKLGESYLSGLPCDFCSSRL